MAEQSRFARLKNPKAYPVEIIVAWTFLRVAFESVSDVDIINQHLTQLRQICHFLISPAGNLVIFVLGLAWLAYLVVKNPNQHLSDSSQSERLPTPAKFTLAVSGLGQTSQRITDIVHRWEQGQEARNAVVRLWNDFLKELQKAKEKQEKDQISWEAALAATKYQWFRERLAGAIGALESQAEALLELLRKSITTP